MKYNKKAITLLVAVLWVFLMARTAWSDPRKLDKLRQSYRDHNLDFFSELITDERDLFEDEKRRAKIELLADDARSKALAQLDHLLKRAKGDAEPSRQMIAELLIRKAKLLADRARTANYFQNNSFKTSRLKAPAIYLRSSIETYQRVAKGFPRHGAMDVILFSIAYNHAELKLADTAYRYYGDVVSRFPASPLAADAQLAMGEIQFEKRQFGKALRHFDALVKAEDQRLKNFALYKSAWCHYNLRALEEAIGALEGVVSGVNAMAEASASQRARIELRREALQDLVGFYAERTHASAAEKASEYFGRVARTPEAFLASVDPTLSEPNEMLLRLAAVYKDQGKHENAMTVAGHLIAALDRHPRVPALYRLRAESAEKLRHRPAMLAELGRLAERVKRDLPEEPVTEGVFPVHSPEDMSAYFIRAEKKAPVVKLAAAIGAPAEKAVPADTASGDAYARELGKTAFVTLRDFSSFLHGEWSKTGSGETARQALAAYDLAVDALLVPYRHHLEVPAAQALDLRFRRAQLRFSLKQWLAAADDFQWLAQRLQPGEPHTESLKGQIAALESLAKESGLRIKAGTELHPTHQRLTSAYDLYLAHHLSTPKLEAGTAAILATSGRLYKEYGVTQEALARLGFHATRFPKAAESAASVRDVAALLERAERWKELRDFTAAALKLYENAEVARDVRNANQFSSLRMLEQLERDKDWKDATSEFADFASAHPESPFASQALMKSANAALQLKDPELAVERLEEAARAVDSKVRAKALLALEPFYKKARLWGSLRDLYKKVSELEPSNQAVRRNLDTLGALEAASFRAKGADALGPNPAPDFNRWNEAVAAWERETEAFRKLRFTKTNENPQLNFKRKADLHERLSAKADAVAKAAAQALKASAAAWANAAKSELLAELAATIEESALPSALARASEADRKEYSATLAAQSRELRQKAMELLDEAFKIAEVSELADSVETRLNRAAGALSKPELRLTRPSFAAVWEKRPKAELPRKSGAEEIRKLGLKILGAEDEAEVRELLARLALAYLVAGEPGFAYATASDAGNRLLLFQIDAERLPAPLASAIANDSLDGPSRLWLARWLAGFPENEWFTEARRALLRVTSTAPSQVARTR